MKKRIVILFFSLLFSILVINLISSQNSPPTNNSVPNTNTNTGFLEINPDTGLPKSFEEYQKTAKTLASEEEKEEYYRQEWAKILAEQKIIGPILYYTESFFVVFNPLWKIIFGIEFSWSWFFIFSFLIWIGFIIFFYFPVKEFTELNPILVLIGSIAISCIMGTTKVIPKTADLLSFAVKNLFIAILSIIIGITLASLYQIFLHKIGKSLKADSEKEELERAQTIIKKTGKLYEKEFDERTK